jgi:cell division initiation protein
MKITPLDIRQKRFATRLRGFSIREVEAFLELTAGEFEEVVKENIGMREELLKSQRELEVHREREHTLQQTMITAQRISEDLKAAAKKETEILLADAERQAEKIVQEAHTRLVDVVRDINELKRQRTQFESQLRSVVDSHLKLLDTFTSAPFNEEWSGPEDNVSFLPPKKAT